jgi:hypothetical protein
VRARLGPREPETELLILIVLGRCLVSRLSIKLGLSVAVDPEFALRANFAPQQLGSFCKTLVEGSSFIDVGFLHEPHE